METKTTTQWATLLNKARVTAIPIPQIGRTQKLSRPESYSIQEAQLEARMAAGERQIGWKMGLTSEAKRRQMNLDSPLYGFLTDRMQIQSGGEFRLLGSIHPKIEPEIAFRVAKDLFGKVTRDEVLESCSAVSACMEILDSRYDQFKYFSMEDVIADNSSSSHFVLGPWVSDFRNLDLVNLAMTMKVDGQVAQQGISRDISGDPVVSVIQLCELLAERDQRLVAGSIVLAGAATAAVELKPEMKIELDVEGLPSLRVTVKRS